MPLQIVAENLTKMRVDAIVNTTNEEMVGYSGVDLAVHEAAGPELDKECRGLVPMGVGEVKLTGGYGLPAGHVIHTSGPVWQGGLEGESILLRSCYREALLLADREGFATLAFPLISSGFYGYPKDQVLRFAVEVITEFLADHEMTVYLCIPDRSVYEFGQERYREIAEFALALPIERKHCPETPVKDLVFQAPSRQKRSRREREAVCAMGAALPADALAPSLDEYLKEMDKSFAYKLFDWIDRRGMTDVECYKKANVDKKTFSKIKCHPDTYKPSKQTAVAFAIALRLDREETGALLASAGLALSESLVFDRIILYFIQKQIYDIFEINQALFEFDQVLLGC